MWHQKSPRAITQFSVHCHLVWQTTAAAAAAAAVVQRIAWVSPLPNYKVKSLTDAQLFGATQMIPLIFLIVYFGSGKLSSFYCVP